jgi:hypothetical protein
VSSFHVRSSVAVKLTLKWATGGCLAAWLAGAAIATMRASTTMIAGHTGLGVRRRLRLELCGSKTGVA